MSNPTSEQSPNDAPQPQQPFGVPQQPYAQPAYGAVDPQTGLPLQPYGAPVPPAVGPNGFATAGLILGILPTGILGLIFSILGLVRAPKVGGTGRTRSIVGLVLSVLWMAGGLVVGVTAGSSAVKQVATCNATETYMQNLAPKMSADGSNPAAFQKDLQDAVNELNTSAGKVSDKKSAADMRALANDLKELSTSVAAGQQPSADLSTRLTTDGNAVDADCS